MIGVSVPPASHIMWVLVGYGEALCGMAANALRLYSLSFLPCGFNILGSAFFTGLNSGTAGALISFLYMLVSDHCRASAWRAETVSVLDRAGPLLTRGASGWGFFGEIYNLVMTFSER